MASADELIASYEGKGKSISADDLIAAPIANPPTVSENHPIFRSASRVQATGLKGAAAKGLLGVIDILNTPTAALSKLSGQNMGDADPYLAKPLVEKLKADTTGEGKASDDWHKLMMEKNLMGKIPDFAWQASPSAVNATIEQAGRTVSDPLFWLGPLLGLADKTGGALKKTGAKITEAAVKPDVADQAAGYDTKNIFKNNLGGSLKQIEEKTKSLRKSEGEKLNQALAASPKQINAVQLWSDAVGSMEDQVKQGKISGPAVQKISETWRDEINAVADPITGEVSPQVADNLKRRIQRDAKALYKAANIGTDVQGADKEVFAKELASRFRSNLEKEVPGVIEPNKILSETRGIKKAASDAVTRTAKNNPLSLTDILLLSGPTGIGAVTGDIHNAAAGGGAGLAALATKLALNRASKSPWVGNQLYQAGDFLQAPIVPEAVKAALRRAAVMKAAEQTGTTDHPLQ